jgi:hypothetical protein
MQLVRVAMCTLDGALAGAGATLVAECVAVAVVVPRELIPKPPNPTARATAAAPLKTAILLFLIPVIGLSFRFKYVPDM